MGGAGVLPFKGIRMENYMEQGKYRKEFLHDTFLNVMGMLGISCYILADTFFIARGLGADGLTALNLALPIYSVIHGCGLMLGMGGATRFAILKGQKEERGQREAFTCAVCLAAMAAAAFVLGGLFFSEGLVTLLGADAEVFDMSNTYLKIIMLFAPAFLMNDVLSCFVRNDGEPGRSMAAMIVGSLFNIVFDYIFIFPMQMGILGAVLATGCAPLVGMGMLSLHWRSKDHQLHLIRGGMLRPAGRICALGTSSLIGETASGVVMLVFNMLFLRLRGNVGVAAYGVVANLSVVVISIYTGIAQGMQPILSRTYGRLEGRPVQGRTEEVRKRTGEMEENPAEGGMRTGKMEEGPEGRKRTGKTQCRPDTMGKASPLDWILRDALISVLLVSVVIYLLLAGGAAPITALFNRDGSVQMQQIAETGMRLYFLAIPFAGFNIVLTMYFAATERAVPSQIISLLRGVLLIVPAAFTMAAWGGVTGLWLAFGLTESVVAAAGAVWKKTIPS